MTEAGALVGYPHISPSSKKTPFDIHDITAEKQPFDVQPGNPSGIPTSRLTLTLFRPAQPSVDVPATGSDTTANMAAIELTVEL